jgi:phosphoribosylamine--glycine ligase
MGAYAPAPLGTGALLDTIERTCMRPVLSEMERRGAPFSGFLYAGLMITPAGPRVLEYNVRFGDPEAQAVLPLVDDDLAGLFADAARGELGDDPVACRAEHALTVVLAAEGYPASPRKGDRIDGVDAARAEGALVFAAGVRAADDGGWLTNGGRVLTVTGRGATLEAAAAQAYAGADRIRFDGMHCRRDIGYRVLGSR